MRGLTKPCSSISACCFLRKYSCLISSRRAFSSSLRMRSSSALRLEQTVQGLGLPVQHGVTPPPLLLCRRSNLPSLVTFELALCFLLLLSKPGLFGFALLFEEEGGATFGHFVLCFLVILEGQNCSCSCINQTNTQGNTNHVSYTLKKKPSTFFCSASAVLSLMSVPPSSSGSLSSDKSTSIS